MKKLILCLIILCLGATSGPPPIPTSTTNSIPKKLSLQINTNVYTIPTIVCINSKLINQKVTLAWNASTDQNVKGYYFYDSTNSNFLSVTKIDVNTNTYFQVTNLVGGATHYFQVTSYDSSGNESVPTPILSYTVPGYINLKYNNGICCITTVISSGVEDNIIQCSTDLINWSNLMTIDCVSNQYYTYIDTNLSQSKFYRLIQ